MAAGGISDGRGLAAALSYGAAGIWVGTRFVASEEAGAPPKHKELVLSAGYDDVVRTLIYSGRPMSVRRTPYVADWFVMFSITIPKMSFFYREENRPDEIKTLVKEGNIPHDVELEKHPEKSLEGRMWLMGKVAGSISVSVSLRVFWAYKTLK